MLPRLLLSRLSTTTTMGCRRLITSRTLVSSTAATPRPLHSAMLSRSTTTPGSNLHRTLLLPPLLIHTASFHNGWHFARQSRRDHDDVVTPARLLTTRRTIIHIPIIGGIASGKLLALLAVKKAVILAVLQKYGLKGTFELLKSTNKELHLKLGEKQYPKAAFEAVNIGIELMESSMSKLEPKEQAEYIVKWFRSIESVPDLRIFPTEFLKNSYQSVASYFSTTPAKSSATTTSTRGTEDVIIVDSPSRANAGAKKFKLENEEMEDNLLKLIDERIPEVARDGYQVVLIKRKQDE